jgi:hypothetical protein
MASFADRFDEKLARELQGLGRVRHLVSPNQFHYAHIGEWARAFPGTIAWASPRARQRARARHIEVNFTRNLDANAPEEWCEEINQFLFPSGYFKEFIFIHRVSKTLILTDTIIILELDKISEPWRTATRLTGMYHPYGQKFFGMRLPLLLQPRRAKAAIEKIYLWQPQRIVLSHGRCFDADADKVIRGYSEDCRYRPLKTVCHDARLSFHAGSTSQMEWSAFHPEQDL